MLKASVIGCSSAGRRFLIPKTWKLAEELKLSPFGARFLGSRDRWGVFVEKYERRRIEADLQYRHGMNTLLTPRTYSPNISEGLRLLQKSNSYEARGAAKTFAWLGIDLNQIKNV